MSKDKAPEDMPQGVGAALLRVKEETGWSWEQLAEEFARLHQGIRGVTGPTLFRYAKGESKPRNQLIERYVREALDLLGHAEEMIWQREAELNLLASQIPATLWTTDANLRITSFRGANFATLEAKLFRYWGGRSRADLLGMTLHDIFPSNHPSFATIAHHQEALQGRSVVRERQIEGMTFDVRIEPLRDAGGKIMGCLGLALDITERKRVEEQLREREEQYRLLFKKSPLPMFICDTNTLGFLAANDAAVRHYGYSLEEFQGMTAKDIRPAEDVAALLHVHERVSHWAGWEFGSAGMWRHRKKDGTLIGVEIFVSPIHFDGREAHLVLAHDVTAREQLVEELRASEARWRATMDNAVDAIVLCNGHGHIDFFNPASERVFGYKASEVLDRNITVLIAPPEQGEYDRELTEYQKKGVSKLLGTGRHILGQRKDGTMFPMYLAISEATAGSTRRLLVIARDLTNLVLSHIIEELLQHRFLGERRI